jgi:hypothetical protein
LHKNEGTTSIQENNREGAPIPLVHSNLTHSHTTKRKNIDKRQEDLEEIHQMY